MVYPLADYQHCFFIFLCNNVSGMYRKCIAMYRACISSNWLLFYNSILHQTECHCVSNFRVSCSFRFIFLGLFHERVRCMSFHFKWPLDKPMFRKVYHNTIIPMKMFFCVSTWGHFVSIFRVFVSWRFQNVFLWFILFPTRVSCTSWGKISHYHYTQLNSFLCSHLAHICSNIGGFVFCRSQNSFLVFSLFPK